MTGLLLLLFACTGAVPDKSGGSILFPHAEGYDAGAAHGAEALAAGNTTCLSCHRDGVAAPSCGSCHDAYPHPEGWLPGDKHGFEVAGETLAAEQARTACLACHGATGLATPSCGTCHPSYPHPEGWEGPGQHGVWSLTHGTPQASCGACHDGTAEDPTPAPSCTSCHAGWPHPEGGFGRPPWRDPSQHGAADQSTCAACHGVDGTGGNSAVACSRCHASFPHPAGWAQGHVAVANQSGQGACLDCHTAPLAPQLPAACGSACHGGPR